MYKFTNFCYLMKKRGKNLGSFSKKLILVRSAWNLMVAMTTSKVMDTIDISKFLHRMKEQLLKLSAP